MEREKIEKKYLFDGISVKALNDYHLDTGIYFECEDGQVATVGKDEIENS